MTANELRYNILLGVDSLFQGTAPGYNNRQMSSIINRAQRRIFRKKAILFDSNEKVKRMLAPVVGRATIGHGDIVPTTDINITDYPHETSSLISEFYTLSDKVAFIVEESVRLDDGTDIGDPIIVFPITYDYFTKNYKSRYKKPHEKLIWRMDAQLDAGKPCVELIFPTGYTIDDYFVAYLRYPTDIVVDVQTPANQIDCEIPDSSFQDELIGEAIKVITASLNEEGYQVANAEANFDEN
jgi:hypothetical protein